MFKNSFASPPSEPFFTTKIVPACAMTKKRPEPSGASLIQTGRSICKFGKNGLSSIFGSGCAKATAEKIREQKICVKKMFGWLMATKQNVKGVKCKVRREDFYAAARTVFMASRSASKVKGLARQGRFSSSRNSRIGWLMTSPVTKTTRRQRSGLETRR